MVTIFTLEKEKSLISQNSVTGPVAR